MFHSTPGKSLIPEQKEVIIKLKLFFDENKSEFKSKKLSVELVADAMQIGLATVKRVLAAYQKDPESIYRDVSDKGRPKHAVDCEVQEKVRYYIRTENPRVIQSHFFPLFCRNISGFETKQFVNFFTEPQTFLPTS